MTIKANHTILKDSILKTITEQYNKDFQNLIVDNLEPLLNHGYKSLNDTNPIQYNKEDIFWQNQSNLYIHLIELFKKYNTEIKNLKVLDVGCGLGKGTHLLKKYYNFTDLSAVDINVNFINFAKQKYKDINYLVGDATNLNFSDESYDLILNVESLHNYKYTYHFYNEVKRILKPGGYLLLTDPFIPYKDDLISEDFFNRSGLYMLDKINITNEVINACKDDITKFCDKDNMKIFYNIAKQKFLCYSNKEALYFTYVYTKL